MITEILMINSRKKRIYHRNKLDEWNYFFYVDNWKYGLNEMIRSIGGIELIRLGLVWTKSIEEETLPGSHAKGITKLCIRYIEFS